MLKKLLVLKWNVLNAIKKSKDTNKNNKALFSEGGTALENIVSVLDLRSRLLESQSCCSVPAAEYFLPSPAFGESIGKIVQTFFFF